MKSQKSTLLTDRQVADMVIKLIEQGVVDEALYNLLCGQGHLLLEKRLVGKSSRDLHDEAHELAVEFMLHLRSKRLAHLQTAAHLKHELSKYLTRRDSPIYHEVWKILSQALIDLERDGVAVRLPLASGANRQTTEWCSNKHEGNPSANQQGFSEVAGKLPVYYPARTDGRLLSPTQARELAEQMLELAGGPILMQDLHGEAMKHVVSQMLHPISIEDDSAEEGKTATISRQLADRMQVFDFILQEEAESRARRIWAELEKSGDGQAMCVYFLPKHLLGVPVTGSELGDPRRISEASMRIRRAFQESMDFSFTLAEKQEASTLSGRDPSGGGMASHQAWLLGRISEVLIEFCSEKSWDGNLKTEKGEP